MYNARTGFKYVLFQRPDVRNALVTDKTVLLLVIMLLLFNCFNLFVICHDDKMNNLINSARVSFIYLEYSRD